MHKRIKEIDRAELHSHLGSSVPVEVLWELAHEQGIRLPVSDYDDFEMMITM
jgi:adenosine deaminase